MGAASFMFQSAFDFIFFEDLTGEKCTTLSNVSPHPSKSLVQNNRYMPAPIPIKAHRDCPTAKIFLANSLKPSVRFAQSRQKLHGLSPLRDAPQALVSVPGASPYAMPFI
ncbi:hypothetical protein J1614_008489 [Plenodomus biglobosus]|nr:hypothetical protein J1614_008489 [Plenodomus biglobosus]